MAESPTSTPSHPQVEGPWGSIVNRLRSGRASENMAAMSDMIMVDERRLTAVQRNALFGITSFIATVYRRAYVFEHLDYLMYQYKAVRIGLAMHSDISNDDFMTLTNGNSEQAKLLRELPHALSNTSSVGGIRDDITLSVANEIVDYLESDKFRDFVQKLRDQNNNNNNNSSRGG